MITKSKKKRIGAFSRQITIRQSTLTSDGMGGNTSVSSDLLVAWANIQPIKGTQRLHLQAINSNISHIINIRKTNVAISNENWIEFDTHKLNIHYVINEGEDNAFLEIGASYES